MGRIDSRRGRVDFRRGRVDLAGAELESGRIDLGRIDPLPYHSSAKRVTHARSYWINTLDLEGHSPSVGGGGDNAPQLPTA